MTSARTIIAGLFLILPLSCSEEPGSSGDDPASGGGDGWASGGAPAASGGLGGTASGGVDSGGSTKTLTWLVDTSATGANVAEDVAHYPLALQLNAENFDFASARADGTDLRFEGVDGTPLPFEIERWDPSANSAAIWIHLDLVRGDTAGQEFVMRWGGEPPELSDAPVFPTEHGFFGVWHLAEEGNTTPDGYRDSSEHQGHATGVNMIEGSSVAARVGHGVRLENPTGQNTARWLRVTGEKATAYNPDEPLTVSIWALAKSYPISSYETIFSKGDTSWSLQRVTYAQTGYQSCLLAGSGTTYHFCIYNFADQPLVTDEWLHFMLVLDEPTMTLFINGRQNASGTGSNWHTGNHDLGIGNQTQFDERRQWDGILDEARVMRGARSQSWARLDYEGQKQNQTLVKPAP